MRERFSIGTLSKPDVDRLKRLKEQMKAESLSEVIRRLSITAEAFLHHQKRGDIVLCRKGRPDKVVWLL